MTEYSQTYSLVTNFPNGLNRYQLQQQIAATAIVPVCNGIITNVDAVYIIFSDTLSISQISILNTLVQNYIYVSDKAYLGNVLSVTPTLNSVSIPMYKRVASLVMPATTTARVYTISSIEPTATSYDIIFINRDSAQILLQVNLTNTTETKQDLGYLSNLPNTQIQLDISVRKNGGTTSDSASISNITIQYS